MAGGILNGQWLCEQTSNYNHGLVLKKRIFCLPCHCRHALWGFPDEDDGVEKSQEESSWVSGECSVKVGNPLTCRTDECTLESKKRDFLIAVVKQFDMDKVDFGMEGLL